MITGGQSVLIESSVIKTGSIETDIWYDDPNPDDVSGLAASFLDYYLKQMNFLGNLRRV